MIQGRKRSSFSVARSALTIAELETDVKLFYSVFGHGRTYMCVRHVHAASGSASRGREGGAETVEVEVRGGL